LRARSPVAAATLASALALALPSGALAQDDLLSSSQTAARGLYQLCLEDAPDAGRVAEHGEIWGWPPFEGYLEHPEGFKREAGGESRREFTKGDTTAFVEATVQSGEATAALPAHIVYFRCNMASDQPVDGDLADYFTGLWGPPASDDGGVKVWLTGAAKDAAASEDGALKAVAAAGAGAKGMRIELSRENGLDRAKLTLFVNGPAS
jgi:hypothetical protein